MTKTRCHHPDSKRHVIDALDERIEWCQRCGALKIWQRFLVARWKSPSTIRAVSDARGPR
jgi:hypothetical protein